MKWSTIPWVMWGVMFVIIEGIALRTRAPGDTLSEHVWRWFRVRTPRTRNVELATRNNGNVVWTEPVLDRRNGLGWAVVAGRVVLLAFLVWLTMHLAFGWWGGGMFPTITLEVWPW